MSMYSQPPSFSQPPYPVHAYHPPQPPPHAYPSTSAIYPVDASTFRRDYTARLAELTENSRPIIQGLSFYAQEWSRWADVAVQCIEAHIRRVPPWMKLPAFYLVDAISKNLYDPFAHHFASIVSPLFLETYGQVDPVTRTKMEEMLLTWRNGGPNGRQLFGVGVQNAIERGIWGSSSGAEGSANGFISKAQVLSELQFTLNQTQQRLSSNPYDTEARNNLGVLQQLRMVVEEGVSQQQLVQIRGELRSLVRPPAPIPAAPMPSGSSTMYPPPASSFASTSYPQPRVAPPSALPQLPYSQPLSTVYPTHDKLPTPLPAVSPSSLVDTVSSNAASASSLVPDNISNLLNTLTKAGWGSANGTPTGAGTTVKTQSQVEESIPQVDHSREAAREYREAILSANVKFTSADITRNRPNIVHFLYDRLAVQCKQCGVRFPDTTQGKKTMEGHLDQHFRQNRKANQNVGRGHSRSWFVGVEDWVHDVSASSKGKESADPSRPLNSKVVAAAEAAKRDAELRAQFVVVPPGDEAKHVACPICQETLKSEFNEDDEEWVWKNAVKADDDRIYHATCHADALNSLTTGSTLVARLLQGIANGSRSGTPDASLSRITPPPRTGLTKSKSPSPVSKLGKRKVDADTTDVKAEDGTPPLKKMVLSATA
ncbi:hypothetical protein BV25DRAFT_1874001 [Artomyces pyxidatus]|uniref:Uncharacterized protein n=1 Tax=Artomyces pyxidatus TaxID=48021 RepID=A0ACB8TK40_9AGAM|nr:hypothetical protein BV25DRAFT_1874001 [Artomyces pyxidatus]